MGSKVVALNQQDVSVRMRVLDDADGTPKTDLVAATAGHEIWYQRGENTAPVTDGVSAADHAAITDAHTDWEFIHIREGWYRVDYPDAAFLEGVGSVLCGMNATGFTGISVTVVIEPLFKFQGNASSVTATTTTFPAGTKPYKGDFIYVVEGTGIKQTRLVKSVAGEVATHDAWTVNISAANSTILLIAGDQIAADGGINCDALISSRSTLAAGASMALTDTERQKVSPYVLISTTIATLTSQVKFTLTDGSLDNDAYNKLWIAIKDGTTADQRAVAKVLEYVGATKEVTLAFDPGIFTMAVGDFVSIWAD